MLKIEYAKSAFADLKLIERFISRDSAYYAKSFLKQMRERILTLQDYPEHGRFLFPERFQLLRQVLFKSYRIIYYYENNKVTILTIQHQSRELGNVDSLKPFEI